MTKTNADFKAQKKKQLNKADLSKKGRIDKGIKDVVELLNKSKKYYTTSSCSGRIILLRVPKGGRKDEAEWLYSTHGFAVPAAVLAVLRKHSKCGNYSKCCNKSERSSVWFKQEAAILHVAAKSIEDAEALLENARSVGFKRSGIISTKRIVMEIIGTESMSTIVARDGKLIASPRYIKILVQEANKKMKINSSRIEMFGALLMEKT